MSVGPITKNKLDPSHQENLLKAKVAEIEKLEKLMDSSVVEIEGLQTELKDLERDLNYFLDQYYGSGAIFFKNSSTDHQADNDNGSAPDLNEAKKNIYDKIAKVCSQDMFNFSSNSTHEGLLKIEGYLADGTEQSQSPQDLLSNLIIEYYSLIQQMQDLKEKKQTLLESPAYELKQEVMWANIKTAETISRIKEDLTHHINRLE
jgi:hypothetical protein